MTKPPGFDGADPPTRLTIERRGGFAGLTYRAELACETLTSSQRKAVDRVLSGQAAARKPVGGVHPFRYRLQLVFAITPAVELELLEGQMPECLDALLRMPIP